MSISLCVSFLFFPLLSFCLSSGWIQSEPNIWNHFWSGAFHTETLLFSPEQAVLSHSISLPRYSLSLTSTQAHSALFRFCLCCPHKSLSKLDCMFVSSAFSTEKWEAGGLHRCDSAVQWGFTVFMFAPSGLGTLWVMKWTGGKADAWVWNAFRSLKQF